MAKEPINTIHKIFDKLKEGITWIIGVVILLAFIYGFDYILIPGLASLIDLKFLILLGLVGIVALITVRGKK